MIHSQSAAEMVIHVSIISGVCLSLAWCWEFLCTVPSGLSMPYLGLLPWGEPLNNPHGDYCEEFLPFCGENTHTTPSGSVTFAAYTTCWKVVMPIWLATKINEKTFLCDIKSVNRHWGISPWIAKSSRLSKPFNDSLAELLEKSKFLFNFKGADLMSPLRVPGELHLFVPVFVTDMPWIRLLSDAQLLLGGF